MCTCSAAPFLLPLPIATARCVLVVRVCSGHVRARTGAIWARYVLVVWACSGRLRACTGTVCRCSCCYEPTLAHTCAVWWRARRGVAVHAAVCPSASRWNCSVTAAHWRLRSLSERSSNAAIGPSSTSIVHGIDAALESRIRSNMYAGRRDRSKTRDHTVVQFVAWDESAAAYPGGVYGAGG